MAENIFLFIPNLIGYARVILLFAAIAFMLHDHVKASSLYLLSALLDMFDGMAARRFNQSTKFGAILDQITDRCGLLALLTTLCFFYPNYFLFFQSSMLIDIASHWIHIWSSLFQGKTSHKFVDPSANPILRLYYHSRPVLFSMCAGNEIFYASLYLMHFTPGPIVPIIKRGLFPLLVWVSAPVAIAKMAISVIQLIAACINVGIIDTQDRLKAVEKSVK